MENNHEFFLTLPSNSSLRYYADNTLASFRVQLPRTFDLQSDSWECGLSEIQFPTRLEMFTTSDEIIISAPIHPRNFPESETLYSASPFGQNNIHIIKEQPTSSISEGGLTLGKKYRIYSTRMVRLKYKPKSLAYDEYMFMDDLNNFIESSTMGVWLKKIYQDIPIKFVYTRGGLKIYIRASQVSITLGPNIARVLGFPLNDQQFLHLNRMGIYEYTKQKINLSANRPSFFYVYCNLIQPSLVGDAMVPNLRAVLLPQHSAEQNEFVSTPFSPINYYPMALKSFHTVEIELRNNAGQKVPFVYGIVNVILHCRRRRSHTKR